MLILIKTPLIILLVSFFSIGYLFVEIFVRDPATKHHMLAYQTHLCSRVLLLILGVIVEAEIISCNTRIRGNFIVSNHLSYLDVFILSSLVPTVFVTSKEVEESGFLGFISRASGALFVERRKRTQLSEEIEQLKVLLDAGLNVAVFPEGTTSSGESILPFKSVFFDAAIRSRCNVLPVCINYKKVNSFPVNSSWKESLFYYGTMEFFPHFLKLLSLKSIQVGITVNSPIFVKNGCSRKELSSLSFSKIISHYHAVV